jgi:hypothetical protein
MEIGDRASEAEAKAASVDRPALVEPGSSVACSAEHATLVEVRSPR